MLLTDSRTRSFVGAAEHPVRAKNDTSSAQQLQHKNSRQETLPAYLTNLGTEDSNARSGRTVTDSSLASLTRAKKPSHQEDDPQERQQARGERIFDRKDGRGEQLTGL